MKKIVLAAALVLSTIAFAQNKNARVTLKVDGVCGMCKERIEKAAIKTKGVKSAVWNIETHDLKLIYNEHKTDIKTISKKLASVGHDTKLVKATEEAYNSVHPCCRYRNKEIVDEHKDN